MEIVSFLFERSIMFQFASCHLLYVMELGGDDGGAEVNFGSGIEPSVHSNDMRIPLPVDLDETGAGGASGTNIGGDSPLDLDGYLIADEEFSVEAIPQQDDLNFAPEDLRAVINNACLAQPAGISIELPWETTIMRDIFDIDSDEISLPKPVLSAVPVTEERGEQRVAKRQWTCKPIRDLSLKS